MRGAIGYELSFNCIRSNPGGFFAWGFLSKANTDKEIVKVGSLSTLGALVAKLMISNTEAAYLGVRPTDSSEFFQLTADSKCAQIKFPLVTKEQKDLASKITEVAAQNNFPLQETKGSDGARILDIEITGNANQISEAVKVLLKGVFDISKKTRIEYRYRGI